MIIREGSSLCSMTANVQHVGSSSKGEQLPLDKTNKKDSDKANGHLDAEPSLVSSAPVSRFDIGEEAEAEDGQYGHSDHRGDMLQKPPEMLDFTFHKPTAADIFNLKIVGFSCLLAVAMMMAAFVFAAGLLSLF